MKKLFAGKKVLIAGLGLQTGGASAAKFFCLEGADVLVTDLKTKKQLADSLKELRNLPINYVLARHRKKDFISADLIIKNPAVPKNSPFLKEARKNKVPIKSDVEIFFELSGADIIGITGTKGKSTTAALLYELLKEKYRKVLLAGNIGISPLKILKKAEKGTKVVLELSSFELEDLKVSPKIALITNLLPDHLNRYRSFAEYVEAKMPIFRYQKKNDILILNYDSPESRKLARSAGSKVYFFSAKNNFKKKKQLKFAAFVREGRLFFNKEKRAICSIYDIKLKGEHNLYNILAAVSIARLLKISPGKIKKVLSSFRGIKWRQELISEKRGVRYVNDTTATMPEAAISALISFRKNFPLSKIILIAGGKDKNLNYKNFAKEIKDKVSRLILLPGSASEKIKREIYAKKGRGRFSVDSAFSMAEAVKKGASCAKKGDIVILSPAAASFNLFENEFDRGRQFNLAVKRLKQ